VASRHTDRARARSVRGQRKGRLNKRIAGDLGIVEQTVKFHRARIMERTQARTTAELMSFAATLGIH
jgi:FixJ family two-component response regulator